jgi:hypothetical protein
VPDPVEASFEEAAWPAHAVVDAVVVVGGCGAGPLPDGVEALELVRRYEPVLCFTAGELFFPMPVDRYLAEAALWSSDPHGRPATQLVDHGLDPDRLAELARTHPQSSLFLRYVPQSLPRRELRAWRRRPDRPRFTGISRLAAVGLVGRLIDSLMRLSLTLRGRVPGGLTAAVQQRYALTDSYDAYHAHVSTDGGYVVIQYWFLYAMNDWRSSFSGVNDHESDWEQITVFLAPAEGPTDDGLAVAWVAFSSHDETGDDLRRRFDDPDIGWVDGTHPIAYAGAGSHSNACLAGDYLVRVQPPALERVFRALTWARSRLFPWTSREPSRGVGIPYVDYRRGDGVRIGPGTGRPWTPILIDADTPWVRDYRGLWGLDTADPFGGERAPAGPRYERSGAIRASWADPVGWAGLDKVPPTRAQAARAEAERVRQLDEHIAALAGQIAEHREDLRRTAAAAVTARREAITAANLIAQERTIAELRASRRFAVNERDQLLRAGGAPPAPPHAHLRHRAVPDVATSTGVLLRFWAGASLSVLLILLGLALLLDLGNVLVVSVAAVVIVTGVEATIRGHLLGFLLGLASLTVIGLMIWLLLTNLRTALGVAAIAAAVAIGVANLRTLLGGPSR